MDLKELKSEYSKIEKKYGLPNFKDLNEDFEIDRIERDSDCLIRIIRKTVIEKIASTVSFLETFLNPSSPPRIYLPFVKSMTSEDSKKIQEIYGKLSELTLSSLSLEFKYDEKEEAELIKNSFETWNKLKPQFSELVSKIREPPVIIKKERNYFG